MANDIKQRIVLEGEKEYSAAIKEAKRNLSVLRSELKAETAELGKNATAQEKNAAKVKNLQKQIAEQEKVVKTYESALKEVKEKYGDNEEAIAKWEIKLNDARAALANMKNSLDDVGTGVKQTTTDMNTGVTAANSLADSFSKLGEVGASVAGSIEGIFTSIIGTISQTVQAVWTELINVAAKSDNYLDLAAFFGSSATEVQKWDLAMQSAGGSLDTVSSLITKLKYSGKNQSIATWFGISDVNYTNDLLYFQDVMQSMFEKRKEMQAAGTWDTAMVEIFGNKKGFDVEGVLSDWESILAGLNRFDAGNGGYGNTEEQIEKMGELYLKVENLKASWEALKGMALVELTGDLALNITGNLQNIVDAFKEYFQAEDDAGREAALQTIHDNIVEIFENIGNAIEDGIAMLDDVAKKLQDSDNPTVQALGNVLETVVKTLQWFADPTNWDAVKKGFEALIGIWVTGKAASAIGAIASFAAHIKTISGASIGSSLTNLFSGGSGFGSLLAGAGYLAVGLMMVAPAVQKLFDPHTWEQSDIDKGVEKVAEETPAEIVDQASKKAGYTNQDIMRGLWNRATYTEGSDTSGLAIKPTGQKAEPVTDIQSYLMGISDRGTIELAQLASQLYGTATSQGNDAWLELQRLWGGEEMDMARLNAIFDAINSLEIPADSWNNNSENEDNNGMASILNGLPRNIANAVTNIKVIMDGQEVGTLVAPYVSESIARNIYY